MAHDERDERDGRRRQSERGEDRWGRETPWRGDQGFGGGWGNQTARPPRADAAYFGDGGSFEDGGIRSGGPGFGGGGGSRGPAREFEITRHDRQYAAWRDRQLAEFDRDYDDYVRENQSRFDSEFGAWRERRGAQRQAIGRVTEHMEVTGADGGHVGTVDKVAGDRIILARSDPDSGGVHHSIPCGWIGRVDDKVVLDIDAEEARSRWRDETRSRALFEREHRGASGPHVLNRSFAGTYPDEE